MPFLSSLLETLHTDRKTIQHIAYVKLLQYKTHESHSRRLKYIVTLGGAIFIWGHEDRDLKLTLFSCVGFFIKTAELYWNRCSDSLYKYELFSGAKISF